MNKIKKILFILLSLLFGLFLSLTLIIAIDYFLLPMLPDADPRGSYGFKRENNEVEDISFRELKKIVLPPPSIKTPIPQEKFEKMLIQLGPGVWSVEHGNA